MYENNTESGCFDYSKCPVFVLSFKKKGDVMADVHKRGYYKQAASSRKQR